MNDYSIGKKYHMLTIIGIEPPYVSSNGRKRGRVKVRCDCGNEKIVISSTLSAKHNGTYSCGCYHRTILRAGNARKYEHSSHPLYRVWLKIKERCLKKYATDYKNYGGRGIDICDEWLNSYEMFYKWAISNNYKKEYQIDRKNNDSGYSPDNCRFVGRTVNCNNKRNNIIVRYNGIEDTLSNMLRMLNLIEHYKLIHTRIRKYGWSFEKSIKI